MKHVYPVRHPASLDAALAGDAARPQARTPADAAGAGDAARPADAGRMAGADGQERARDPGADERQQPAPLLERRRR